MEIYGAPKEFCSAIHRMYQYLIVLLHIGNSIEEIIQEVVVIQGVKIPPVLFLFFNPLSSQISSKLSEKLVIKNMNKTGDMLSPCLTPTS